MSHRIRKSVAPAIAWAAALLVGTLSLAHNARAQVAAAEGAAANKPGAPAEQANALPASNPAPAANAPAAAAIPSAPSAMPAGASASSTADLSAAAGTGVAAQAPLAPAAADGATTPATTAATARANPQAVATTEPGATDAAPRPTAARSNPLGLQALDLTLLSKRRGTGDPSFSDMQLKGVVAENKAINVNTGNNVITEGAFSHAAGLPMIVQNTGNNVLIQNATIVNVQVK